MSIFFCDTNCEMRPEDFRAYDIKLIKMPYTVNGGQVYYNLDGDTDYKAFFDAVRGGASVKTQALNSFDYIEYFKDYMAAGNDILYLSFSHKMSGTFLSLNQAADELKTLYPNQKITVIDTSGISQAAGTVVLAAAKMHAEGATDKQIADFVAGFCSRVKTYFTVESLEYLKRGGRLSGFQAFFGTLLNIKPIITIRDGALVSQEKCKGSKAAQKRILALIEEGNPDLSYPIYCLDAFCEDFADFVSLLQNHYPSAIIKQQFIGPVIGCHCGPGTIGVVLVSKQDGK